MASVRASRKGIQIVIQRSYTEFVNKKYSQSVMRNAAREVAATEIDLIRKRAQKGLDRDGRQMKPYTPGYEKQKRAIIKNGYRVGRRSLRPTAFAATRVNQFMRLSGRMFRDMYVRNLSVARNKVGTIIAKYTLDFRTQRSKDVADYNETGRRPRKFWGHAKTIRERNILTKVMRKALK